MRAQQGIKGGHGKGGKDRTGGNFGGNGGPKVDFVLTGAAGVLADVGPVGHKRRHGKGKIGRAGIFGGNGKPKVHFFLSGAAGVLADVAE